MPSHPRPPVSQTLQPLSLEREDRIKMAAEMKQPLRIPPGLSCAVRDLLRTSVGYFKVHTSEWDSRG